MVQPRFQAASWLCLLLQQGVTSLPYIRYQVLIAYTTKQLTSDICTVWCLTVCGILSPYLNVLGGDHHEFSVVEVLPFTSEI
jgi:hypothetical protein